MKLTIHEKINIKSYYTFGWSRICFYYKEFIFLSIHGYYTSAIPFEKWMQDQIDKKEKARIVK